MFSSHSAPRGVLTVTLVEASNLHKEDFCGHNDPYVELWLKKEYKQRSSTQKDTENPLYNETFTFNIEEGCNSHKLFYKISDKDITGSDKIGDGDLDFSKVFEGQTIDTWSNLPAKLGLTSHGKIHFIIKFDTN